MANSPGTGTRKVYKVVYRFKPHTHSTPRRPITEYFETWAETEQCIRDILDNDPEKFMHSVTVSTEEF